MDTINDFIKNNKLIECVSYLREHTKCYHLAKLLCHQVIKTYKNIPLNFYDDYAIILYYLNEKNEAYDCYNYIMQYDKSNLKEQDIDHYINNIKHCMPLNMKNTQNKIIKLKNTIINKIVIPKYNDYNAFNPSIILSNDKTHFIMNVRTANYEFNEYFRYKGDGYVETINYIVKLDFDLNITSINKLVYQDMKYNDTFDGWEDLRLFYYKNKLHCSFTTLQATENRLQHICIANLEDNNPKHILLDNYGNDKCQKNWVPLNHNDELYFIYSFYPLIILKYNDDKQNVDLYQSSLTGLYNVWRGGTPAISLKELGYDNYYLCVVHESNFPQYTHRFVLLHVNNNNIFEVYNYTPSFCFINNIIEFCCGLTLSHDNKQFILSFGKLDRETYIAKIDINIINSLIDTKLKIIENPNIIHRNNILDSPYTFVSCFFNLAKLENRDKSIEQYLEKSKFLLHLNIKLIFFSDDDMVINHVLTLKPDTIIIKMNLSDTPYFKYLDLIKQVRNYNGFKQTKDTPLFTILTWTKFYLIKYAIEYNYFNTDYFMWIDFGITYVATIDNYINSFNLKNEKILIECINMPTSSILNIKDTFDKWVCHFGEGLFGGNKEYMLKFTNKFDEYLLFIIQHNMTPLEGGVIAYIYYLHPELFDLYYGDYSDIIDNRSHLYSMQHIDLIYYNIDKSILNKMNIKACHIVKYILKSYYNGYIQLNNVQYNKLMNYYVELFN